ncbi:hypothetical protein Efla_003514 [Eimeria flavescens]
MSPTPSSTASSTPPPGEALVAAPVLKSLELPERLLLGPGPSNFSQEVLHALSLRPLGYMDPAFLQLLDQVQQLLRYCFQTENEVTLAVSGTGSAAMETALANLIEEGDVVLVAVNGYFGRRLAEMASRYGADVRVEEIPWGSVFSLDALQAALLKHRPRLLCVVSAETSTGALQPLEGLGALCREQECLLLVDAVTSLAMSPLYVDRWLIDVCFSCSQKGLSCCPGASPLTFGPRALEKIRRRSKPVRTWYLDLHLLLKYWHPTAAAAAAVGEVAAAAAAGKAAAARVYHHTPPMNVLYGLREALRLVAAEGLENVWRRHKETAAYLTEQLAARGLCLHVKEETHRAPALSAVVVPAGVDAAAVCRCLLSEGVEVGVGMGELAGKPQKQRLEASCPSDDLLLLYRTGTEKYRRVAADTPAAAACGRRPASRRGRGEETGGSGPLLVSFWRRLSPSRGDSWREASKLRDERQSL